MKVCTKTEVCYSDYWEFLIIRCIFSHFYYQYNYFQLCLIKMMSYNTQFNKTYDGKMRKYSYSEVHNQIQKVLLTDVRRCSTVPCILSAVEPLSWNCLSTSGLRVNSILCGFEIKMWYGLVYILFYWLSKTGAIA